MVGVGMDFGHPEIEIRLPVSWSVCVRHPNCVKQSKNKRCLNGQSYYLGLTRGNKRPVSKIDKSYRTE